MNFPADLKYTDHDEWVRVEGDVIVLGISDFAQDALGELVHIEILDVGSNDELAESGRAVDAGDAIAEVESVKAVAEVYSPVAGEVIAFNEALEDEPELVNSDPYGAGWLVKIRMADPSALDSLLDASAYEAKVEAD